jgi:aldehyde:ferredoxin oxidoreductase
MPTYTGKLLRINLGNTSYKEEDIPVQYYKQFISARGLGVKYLYDELSPNIDPLSPQNKLLMLIGVLGGTGLQGFSKWVVMSKSPLTGTIMRSYTGGNFGVWMKFAGYDLIIVEGQAVKPSYIYIDKDGVHFLEANDLLGLDPRQVQQCLKDRHGPKTESACIGLAGEKLVRYAVITSGERTASRGGLGTVMGSKNLKAVAINVPVRKPRAFDEAAFKSSVMAQVAMLKENPRRKAMTTVGTPYITMGLMKGGVLPVKNFREGSIENIESIGGDEYSKLKKEKAGCYGCMTRCGGMRDVKRGPLKGTRIDGPEYETIYAFGPLLGITDKQFIVDANALCDYYGLDTISAGVCIAFASELFEKGIITSADTDGLDLTWGNKDAVLDLLEKIGRREGLGDILSQGVKRAAQYFGEETLDCAMHIKGLELPGYEPRAVKGYGLSMATSNIGGSHMYGRPRPELAGKVDPFREKEKGASIAQVQKEQAIEDSLIACTFGNSGLHLQKYAEFLTAATGIHEFADTDYLLEIGERIICLERCFNVREGFRREHDLLPARMISEPLKNAGPSTGQVVKAQDILLDEYYHAFGYTKNGIPRIDKLTELGLNEAVQDIANHL